MIIKRGQRSARGSSGMEMYEIVFSQGFLDAGLCIEENLDGTPKRIMARADKYSPDGAGYYGGIQFIQWVHSGKYVEKHEWLTKTNQQMSVQDVADVFGINLSKLRRKYHKDEAAETMTLKKQYTDGMFDIIKNELIEKLMKELDEIEQSDNIVADPCLIYGYEKGVTDALKVIKIIVEQHRKN